MKLALVNYKTIGTVAFSEEVAKDYIFRHFNIIDNVQLVQYSEQKYARRLTYLLVIEYKDSRRIAYPKTVGIEAVLKSFDTIKSILEVPFKRRISEGDLA
mgnify:CR=1 FL=1|tara:strand:- start:120 stop:419 length:300 start_codon:yes stop_codon:yes gene_type:complete